MSNTHMPFPLHKTPTQLQPLCIYSGNTDQCLHYQYLKVKVQNQQPYIHVCHSYQILISQYITKESHRFQ